MSTLPGVFVESKDNKCGFSFDFAMDTSEVSQICFEEEIAKPAATKKKGAKKNRKKTGDIYTTL